VNYFDYENTAEFNRQRIHTELNQIRLEEFALKSRVYQPGTFTHLMFNFANWMIATGKQLRKRYEIPTPNHTHNHSKRFAH
jgi:hypothetical protein